MRKQTRNLIIVLVLLVASIGLSWWWQASARHGKYRDLFSAIYVMGVVKTSYYQPVAINKMAQAYWKTGNIAGMLKVLNDPYTRYLAKAEFAELRKETRGSFGGIGVYLLPQNGELIISKIVDNSPSAKAGLQKGDRITKVGKFTVKHLSTDVAIAKIKGPVGSKVSLQVVRGNGNSQQVLKFKITRANILIPTVEMATARDAMLGKYAVINIYQFADTTSADLEQKLNQIDRSADYKGLILDLRENPGGSLDAAVKVVSQFIGQGKPVLHIYRRGRLLQTLNSDYYVHKQLPMVVLVDARSASAAEIVSGALKDHHRAVLVGTPTFGKDLIQEVKELPGNVAVTITIANYLTPAKVKLHKVGIQPNQLVEIKGAMDLLLKKGQQGPFQKMQQLQDEAAIKTLRDLVNSSRQKLLGAS